MTLAEAGEVQSDEILITPFMDVGSTISHGAVVAREYRIPALVGLQRKCNIPHWRPRRARRGPRRAAANFGGLSLRSHLPVSPPTP